MNVGDKRTVAATDATSRRTMGRSQQQAFMNAWNSPAFVRFRAHHLRKKARDSQAFTAHRA